MLELNKKFLLTVLFILVGGLVLVRPALALAGSSDVEKDNEAIGAPTTDKDDDADDNTVSPSDVKTSYADDLGTDKTEDPGNISFEYFLTTGYVANDIHNIPSIGTVVGTSELDKTLSNAKTVDITLNNDKVKLEPGERLIVFGDQGPMILKKADFDKRIIKNLAILRVRQSHGRDCLADVIASYDLIPEGSPVKLYEGEKALWQRSQVAKEAPKKAIKCYVAGGDPLHDSWNQMDYIVLTGGNKQGIIEGLTFDLYEVQIDADGRDKHITRGAAKVFYTGSNYSLARIDVGSGSIFSGFEAIYRP